jgi:hypothetical protein
MRVAQKKDAAAPDIFVLRITALFIIPAKTGSAALL